MNESLKKNLQQLKEIYLLLTGTPEPEEEEKAQKDLLDLFKAIKGNEGLDESAITQIEQISTTIENWDTLEKWFVEVEGLSDQLKEFLDHFDMLEDLGRQEKKDEQVDVDAQATSSMESGSKTVLDKNVLEEKQKKLEDIEAKMRELEEKERLLREKEKKLREKEKSMGQGEKKTGQSKSKPKSKPKPKPKPKLRKSGLKSKLSAPKLKVPKVKAPKKKITPEDRSSKKKMKGAFQPAPSSSEELKTETQPSQKDQGQKSSQGGIKIDLKASAQPVKINNKPVKIKVPKDKKSGPKIRPVKKPEAKNQSAGVKINPISASNGKQKKKTTNPKIRPVGDPRKKEKGPKIRKVSSPGNKNQKPKIRKVSSPGNNNKKPKIKKAGGEKKFAPPGISKVGGESQKQENSLPKIKKVGSSSISKPKIKPVGKISKPKIKLAGSPKKPNLNIGGPNSKEANEKNSKIPTPQKGPKNLFDQKKKKGPVNLFDQKKGKSSNSAAGSGGVQNVSKVKKPKKIQKVSKGGDIKKVGQLNKIDFNEGAPKSVAKDDSYYATLSPEEVYHELLKEEAKRYFYDKRRNQLEERYEKSGMDEGEYRGQKERYNFEIENCSDKIKEIRNMILGI